MPAAKRTRSSNTQATTTEKKAVVKRELYFDQDRETKGTYRYQEEANPGERPIMGSIWIRKDVADDMGLNGEVKVTIEVVSE